MKVKEFVDSLQKWLDNGSMKPDEDVFVCTNWLSYDDAELFEATFHSMNAPIYDPQNPTKRALCIGILDRIPNSQYIDKDGTKYSWYGTSGDSIEIVGEKKPREIAYEIAKKKVQILQEFIVKFEKDRHNTK